METNKNIFYFKAPLFEKNDNLEDLYISYVVRSVMGHPYSVIDGVENKKFGISAYNTDPVKEGSLRQGVHPEGTDRFFKNKNTEDIVGIFGERQFGIEFGYPVDLELRPDGDGHIDFNTFSPVKNKKITVDVKTARKPYNILVKEWEIKSVSDIVVLSKFTGEIDEKDSGSVELIGWEYGLELAKCPKKDFGYGIVNHYKDANALRPMSELKKLMGVSKKPLDKIYIKNKLILKLSEAGFVNIDPKENKIYFQKQVDKGEYDGNSDSR